MLTIAKEGVHAFEDLPPRIHQKQAVQCGQPHLLQLCACSHGMHSGCVAKGLDPIFVEQYNRACSEGLKNRVRGCSAKDVDPAVASFHD
jgi:hypothetical protein